MKELTKKKKEVILQYLKQGHSVRQAAAKANVSIASVSRIRSASLQHIKPLPAGRPRKLSEKTINILARDMASGKLETATEARRHIEQHLKTDVSAQTIRRAVKERGLRSVV